MPTTWHRARFEAGNHSRSPLQGAITRGALQVSQRIQKEVRLTARSTASHGKLSAHNSEPREKQRALISQSLDGKKGALITQSLMPRLKTTGGGKKRSRDAFCRSWGPKNLRRHSEIRRGSLALTARMRSGRDHSERECVDHRDGYDSMSGPRHPLPCLGKKREALAAAKKGNAVRCLALGSSKR
jgi:hypothetical protein